MCGLKAETVQKRLLSEADLSLKKAVDIAVAMEIVAKDATELQSKQQEATVHKMSREKKTTIQ